MRYATAVLLLLTFGSFAFAKLPKEEWELKSGKLMYHVKYPLKEVTGTSENVKGKGYCKSGACEFLIAVPVKSFISGDGNRDSHMLEVTKASLYPLVSVRVKFPETAAVDKSPETIGAEVNVSFAGQSHRYEHVKISTKVDGQHTTVTGILPLILSDFSIERPSLLGIKIEDAAPVHFELTWN